ncbi:MAG: hypothetical protein GY719_08200 [bacterium]|nr:hypothetical protein [bacterium]
MSRALSNSLLTLAGLLALVQSVHANKPLPERPARTQVAAAQALAIEPDLANAQREGGRLVWRHTVRIEEAAFLKPHFVDLNLRAGDYLIVRSASGRVVERLTGRGPKDAGTFWGLSAFGDTLELELSMASTRSRSPFRIDQVMVGDPAMLAAASGGSYESICTPADFEDVLCYQGDAEKWANVLASVGVMSVGGNATTGLFCSGSNVSPLNYVLTNHHCIEDQAECTNSEFVFRYYRTGCNDGSPANGDWVSFRCDTTVASSPYEGACEPTLTQLDYSLHSVMGDPASTFGFVNVDSTPITSGEDIYIVQHPAGRPHEVTHGGGANVVVDGTTFRYYDTLDTEGGSSGSPIFRDADDALVGLHHCGGCSTPGTGNRGMLMSDIYPGIESFLCTPALSLSGTGATGLAEVDGNGDTVIDPGETWELLPQVRNGSCGTDAVNVQADLLLGAGSAPDVTLLDTSATFGDLAAGTVGPSQSSVSFEVDVSAPCAGEVVIDLVNLTADAGGPYPDDPDHFTAPIGDTPIDTISTEDFAAGIPGTWSIVDGGTGAGAAATWTTDNPGGRTLSLAAPFAIADSDELGTGETMDEELISSTIDVGSYSTVELQFSHDFNWFSGGTDEQADVDVRSGATGGSWVNVANYSGADAAGTVMIDITAQAAGQSDLQIRFHYYDASFEWWWAIDDVFVLGNDGLVCSTGAIFADGFESGDTSAW